MSLEQSRWTYLRSYNSPPGVTKKKKVIPCAVAIESRAYSFIEKRACVRALNCSTWTFTPAWTERSLKVESGTGPEFFPLRPSHFRHPSRRSVARGHQERMQKTWEPPGHPSVCWTCFILAGQKMQHLQFRVLHVFFQLLQHLCCEGGAFDWLSVLKLTHHFVKLEEIKQTLLLH